MRFARTRLLALSAALLAIAARAQTPPATRIDHTPVAKSARGVPVTITAKIENPSALFAPQVYARQAGTQLFQGFTMFEKKKRPGVFSSRLPGSLLNDGALEYFIEARSENGDAARAGSPAAPLTCLAFDPPLVPVACRIKTEGEGAEIRVDGDVIGKTPLTLTLAPGPHTITLTAPDGRSVEKQIDVRSGSKKLDLDIPLPAQAGGPASLTITSEPPAAKVIIDGTVVGVTPWSAPVSPGDHVIAVEMDGRLHQERKVSAREGRDASIAFALPAMPRDPALTIESDPVGALVFVDGKERGRTPFIGPLNGGSHQVVLKKEGHREVGTDFNMPRDHDMSLRLELPKGSGSNVPRLTVSTDPPGASVLVDGKEVGPSPWSGELRTGEHKVQVKLENYKPDERRVTMASGRDADVAFGLVRAPGPGKLRIETDPANARVSIDGQDLGFSPFSGDVPTGEHQLEVSLANFRGVAQTINLEAGQQLSLRLALQEAAKEKLPPLIAVASDPQGAELQLDGKTVGKTPVKARSTPGPHEIKLILDGYTTRTGKINLPDSKDFELRMAISLKPVRGTAETHNAPDQLELARSQLKRAQACYKQGDWKCALESYQVAYQYKPIPELLFNIAQTRRKMGQYEEAAVAYKNFAKETTSPKLKDEAQRYATVCEIAQHPEKRAQIEEEQAAANKPQADLEAARAALGKAQGCYKTADWACALEGYQTAYQFKRIPELLFNIAQARRKLAQYDEAEVAYKNFEKETTSAKMKGEAEKYIAACEAALHPEAPGAEQKAQAELDAARDALGRAQACYKTADYACALEGYRAAYQYKRVPELLFNVAQARRKLGQYAEAEAAYKTFQKDTDNQKMKGEADKYIAACELALHPAQAQKQRLAQVASAKESTAGATAVAVSDDSLQKADTSVEAQTAIASQAGSTTATNSPTTVASAAVDEKEIDVGNEVLGVIKPEPAAKVGKQAAAQLPDAVDEKAMDIGGEALGKASAPQGAKKDMFAADDDTDPPVITHKKIEKAFRGQALRVTARIVDERSDIGNAQACWKNVFQTEYKCAALVKIGEDEFGVEVPAKAVSDGFSYYLEAYDTAENGPARAGAPELPNPVVIEDAPPPRGLETRPAAVAEVSQEERERIAREVFGQKDVPKPAPPPNHILSYIAIGSAVAVVAAGVGLQLHANSSLNSLTQGGTTRTQQDQIRSQASTEQTVSYILFGASGAFALGAVAFWNTNF